jgi:hypothetical protein
LSAEPSKEIRSRASSNKWRHRWLWGVAALCLLFWGSKAIHRATLPKYDGRTMEEWFANTEPSGFFPRDEATVCAFQSMGTNGVWFLWEQYNRKDPEHVVWARRTLDRLSGHGGLFDYEKRRQMLAETLLSLLKPEAEVLMPEIMRRLRGDDPEAATTMASLLISTRLKPEEAVAGLTDSLSKTNRAWQDRMVHMWALSRYGVNARRALPVLRTILASQSGMNASETQTLHVTILSIGGPGPELAFFTNRLVLGDYNQSAGTLRMLSELGTNARPAAPLLLALANTLTNQTDSNRVIEVIRTIDPEGIYQKP